MFRVRPRLAAGPAVAFAAFALFALARPAAASEGYYRYPALRGDTLVFAAEGDLWRVSPEGGAATRLTTHPGEESHPAISPDGTRLAFSAQYEGATEVWVMPLAGGRPERLTWEGGRAYVVGWTPKGQVLYRTRFFSTLPQWQLATADPPTGATAPLPLHQAWDGSFAADGTLFFTRFPAQGSATKRYRGGLAQSVWRFAPGAAEAEEVTADWDGTSRSPQTGGGRVVFLSDRDEHLNLWSMDEAGGDLRQHTSHRGLDPKSPARDGDVVVYQLGADLRRLDLATGADAVIPITLPSDFDQTRTRWVDDPFEYLTAAHVSPAGKRVALTVRGQVFTAPVKPGRLVRVTRRDDVRWHAATFLDEETLVALTDETGELEFATLPANGVGEPEAKSADGVAVHRFGPAPSPDGERIAWSDKDFRLWIRRLDGGDPVLVAESTMDWPSDLTWSPDSRWLAFVQRARNDMTHVRIHDTRSGDTFDATEPRTISFSPAWSRDGKWLWFLSERELTSLVTSVWGPWQPEPFLDRTTRIYGLDLPGGQRSPFRPEDELSAAAEDEENGKKDKKGDKKKDDDEEDAKVEVVIEREGLGRRLIEVPAEPGNYGSLAATADRLFWVDLHSRHDGTVRLLSLPISSDDPEVKTSVDELDWFELSGDGKSLLVRKGNALHVVPAKAEPDLSDGKVDLSGWRLNVDPRLEWRQMFLDAWRMERDWFYDPGLHGLDWEAIRDRYLPLVERVTTRSELRDLVYDMVAELSASHTYVFGGDDREAPDDIEVASLGARLAPVEGGWRVERIYASDPEYPDELSPLARYGLGIAEGDVITAINGVPGAEPGAALRAQAGQQVLLTLRPGGKGDERDVIVEPISARAARNLRYRDWEYGRRLLVEERSEGRLGYVHIRSMGGGEWTRFAREFYPAWRTEGLVIDVRHNTGGNIESWILSRLVRQDWMYWQGRAGEPSWNMQWAYRGKLIVLCDEFTVSDGEVFVEGFRRLDLGPAVGNRTLGGEIWLTFGNRLRDRGIATAAEFGVFDETGWIIEGEGVEPDIPVDNLPHATFNGGDAQLDAAIDWLLEELERDPVEDVVAPPYPDKSPAAE